jgi:hypothetical protein
MSTSEENIKPVKYEEALVQIKNHLANLVTMRRVVILKRRVMLYPAYDHIWLLQRIEIKLDHALSKTLVRTSECAHVKLQGKAHKQDHLSKREERLCSY